MRHHDSAPGDANADLSRRPSADDAPPQRPLAPGRDDPGRPVEARVQAAARHGTRGAGGQLPHLDVIQRLFGRHDVSRVIAHTDGAAAGAARAMGAEAFATGDRICFAGAPSLHTAAHEAAHVVQQRAGLQLAGGVGQRDDAHERHADQVADAVVRGESAERLLDPYAYAYAGARSQATAARAPVVQHKLTAPTEKMAQQASSFREATNSALGHELFRFDPVAVDLRDGSEPEKNEHIAQASATVSQAVVAYMEQAARRNDAALGRKAVEMIPRIPDVTVRIAVIARCLEIQLGSVKHADVVCALCEEALRAPTAGLVADKCSMLLGMEAALSGAKMTELAARTARAAAELCTKEHAVVRSGSTLVDFIHRMYERYPDLVIATVTHFCERAYTTQEDDDPSKAHSAGAIREAVALALRSQPASAEQLLSTVRGVVASGTASAIGRKESRDAIVFALDEKPRQSGIERVFDGARMLRASLSARRFATQTRILHKLRDDSGRQKAFAVLGAQINSSGELLAADKRDLSEHARRFDGSMDGFPCDLTRLVDIDEDVACGTAALLGRVEALDSKAADGATRAEAFAILDDIKKARDALGLEEDDAEALGGAVTGPATGLAGAATTRLIFDCDVNTFKYWYPKLRDAATFEGSRVHASSAAAFVAYVLKPGVEASAAIRAFTMLNGPVVQKLARYLFADVELAKPLLARLVVLRKYALQESGGNFTTCADFLITLASASSYQLPDDPEPRETLRKLAVTNDARYDVPFMTTLLSSAPGELGSKTEALRATISYEQNHGRTLVFRKGTLYVAVKVRKEGESDDELDNEWKQMAHKQGLKLASLVPTPVAVHKSQLPLHSDYVSQITGGTHPVAIDSAHHCLVYESATKDLWKYANDLDVGAEARRTGILSATRDLFGLARQGEIDPALTVKNHNVECGQRRSYEVLIDVMNTPTSRLGAGRLDKLDEMTSFPNVRATGLTDLPDNRFVKDVAADSERDRDRETGVVHHLHWQDKPTADRLHMARYLADYLFDLTLLTATAYQKQGLLKPGEQLNGHVKALLGELKDIFKTAFATFTGKDSHQVEVFLAAAIDLPRLAEQIAFYVEPTAYTALLDNTVAWEQDGADEPARYKGTHKQPATDEARHQLKKLHGTDNVTLSLSYNRGGYIPGDRVSQGQVPGNAHDDDHKHPDLGIVNGSNPLTELERSLYIVAAMMISV
jgi:hypothetical protein